MLLDIGNDVKIGIEMEFDRIYYATAWEDLYHQNLANAWWYSSTRERYEELKEMSKYINNIGGDGSLNDGIEMTTHPLQLNSIDVKDLYNKTYHFIHQNTTRFQNKIHENCGGHIHISMDDKERYFAINNFLKINNTKINELFDWYRVDNRWAKQTKCFYYTDNQTINDFRYDCFIRAKSDRKTGGNFGDRYVECSPRRSYGTIELRALRTPSNFKEHQEQMLLMRFLGGAEIIRQEVKRKTRAINALKHQRNWYDGEFNDELIENANIYTPTLSFEQFKEYVNEYTYIDDSELVCMKKQSLIERYRTQTTETIETTSISDIDYSKTGVVYKINLVAHKYNDLMFNLELSTNYRWSTGLTPTQKSMPNNCLAIIVDRNGEITYTDSRSAEQLASDYDYELIIIEDEMDFAQTEVSYFVNGDREKFDWLMRKIESNSTILWSSSEIPTSFNPFIEGGIPVIYINVNRHGIMTYGSASRHTEVEVTIQ